MVIRWRKTAVTNTLIRRQRERALLGAGVFTLILFQSLLLTGCKGGGSPGGSPAGGDSIKIGVVLPVTGREAKPGQYQREGIQLAFKKINDGGGVLIRGLGKKLPLQEVFYDDGSD